MNIRPTTAEELGRLYEELFVDVFGKWIEHHKPDIVFLFEEGEDILGFASGMQTKHNEIYLQFGGEREKYRGFKSKQRLRQIRDYLHQRFKYILTTVETTNLNMLRLYLSIGYVPYGMKHSTDGATYLELMHTGEEQ